MSHKPKLITEEEIMKIFSRELSWTANWAHLKISIDASIEKASVQVADLVNERWADEQSIQWKDLKYKK